MVIHAQILIAINDAVRADIGGAQCSNSLGLEGLNLLPHLGDPLPLVKI